MISLNVESKKNTSTSEYKKKKQIHKYREQSSGYQCRDGRRGDNKWVENWKVQTIVYKIRYKDMLYNTGNVANIL